MTTELARIDMTDIEQVLVNGDLSKLSAPQRVQYYQRVCQSIGLNPLTKPFDYITLNGKLTLYAKKDATDQLRSIKGVSIDDVDLQETAESFIVKVKGHDGSGRSDVEIGIVKKSDMQGNLANAQMKAVTKAKRRLTLSLCGLGWLDETEIETIKEAKPVLVKPETGEIVDTAIDELDRDYPPMPADWQEAKAQQPAVTNNNKPMNGAPRPYTPFDFQNAIQKQKQLYAGKEVNPKQVSLCAMLLEVALMDEGKDARHTLTMWLFGKASLKDCDGAEVNALLKWLDPQKDSGGAYTPGKHVSAEAKAAYRQALIDEGQQELI